MPAPAAPPRAHGATCRAPVGCCALGGLHGGGAFLSAQQTRWQAAAERAGRHTVGLWTVSGVCVTRPETARPQRRWALRSGTRGGNMPGARPTHAAASPSAFIQVASPLAVPPHDSF